MTQFLSYLCNGISLGSVYAIIALGYTMVYGIAKMLNFAHGDVIMIGAYIRLCAMQYWGFPPILSVLAAMVVCTVLGMVIERTAYKPLRQASSLAVLITAIGMSYLLQNIALLVWGANPKSFPSVVGLGSLSLLGGQMIISGEAIVTIAACVVIMIALTLFTGKTKMGKAMRVVSEDKGAAELMGINVNLTITVTFAIGSPWRPSRACCSARPIRRSSPPPAPCRASRPSRRRCSAASGPFPAPCWAAFCWA